MFKIVQRLSFNANKIFSIRGPPLGNKYPASPSTNTSCSESLYRPGHFLGSTKRSIHATPSLRAEKVTINIVDRQKKVHTVKANVDDSILDTVLDNQLDFDSFGVCEASVACSTCHVIFDEKTYGSLEEPLMDEMDMLDLACGLTETSRLGCQVHVTKEMDGITVSLPEEITDARDL